jgi:small subunit ribosomal protein S1
VADKFELGQLVSGTITKLMDFGAFARIEESIEGLVHVSELSDRHITHPKEVVGVGDILTLKIVSMDLERHRMGLSLKQVEESERAEPVETML